ncbi:MAG: signal transduction histidine kinase/CheY-like chemotaxis protein [Candidatus Azotimanducaceae bacterium]|jgi:signal transduction histidine kinase/CheY-like chemotaxis protein
MGVPTMTSAKVNHHGDIASLEEEQLEVSARHAKSSPLAMFITLGIIANLIYPHSDHYEWAIWLGTVSTFLLFRYLTFNFLFERVAFDASTRVKISLGLSIFHGTAQASSLLFFSEFSEIERALISLILAGFCLQATATGGDVRQYLCFSLPIMPTIAILWTTGGTFTLQTLDATLLGISIAMFYVQQIYIARSNDEKAKTSHDSRTELARLNDELQVAVQQADVANRAKTRFLASASHDLRQPIHALSLFSAALIRQQLPNQAKEVASHINQSVTVLSNQLDALLDLSKLDAGIVQPKIEAVSLQDFLGRIIREYELEISNKGLQLDCDLNVAGSVQTDVLLLERVIRNLLNNAVRYTSEGTISVVSRQVGNGCEITIRDTGLGISLEEQERIFDEFYQVDGQSAGQGLGLGLSIVSRLTRLLDVKLDLQSQVQQGTAFTLTLSNLQGAQVTTSDPAKPKSYSLAGKTILVVDDEPAIRKGMSNLLETYDATVLVAESGEEAERLANENSIDLLITDLGLGTEDGLDMAQKIQGNDHRDLHIILITGDTNSSKLKEAHESEFLLMHKPVNTDELLRRVREMVGANSES